MTGPFRNPIQTVKDDKKNSCQYELLFNREHLLQYLNVEVKFIQELSKKLFSFPPRPCASKSLLFVSVFFSISDRTKSGTFSSY